MKKIFLSLIIVFYTTISFAGGHITKKDKEKAIKCLGHYTSISFIPANEIEAIRLEYALASYKIVREYLLNEKVKTIYNKINVKNMLFPYLENNVGLKSLMSSKSM